VWGSLFFAGARTLEEALPDPADAQAPAVILRMRGHNAVDATLIKILDDYAQRLRVQDGALYLSGVSDQLAGQLKRSGKLVPSSNVHIVRFNSIIGVATKEAITQANQWVADSSHQSLE
jgi:SulP family sulfate permease